MKQIKYYKSNLRGVTMGKIESNLLKIMLASLMMVLLVPCFAGADILFYEDFEDALKIEDEWRYSFAGSHGSQGLTTEQIRAGASAYKFSLTRIEDDYRQELTLLAKFDDDGTHFVIGKEYWIGFSIFLADGYYCPTEDGNWIVHHQYHAVPDESPTCENEPYRNPVLTVATTKAGEQTVSSSYDSRQCTPAIGDYEGTQRDNYGPPAIGRWVDFVINVKWSYGADGFVKVWKDGVLETNFAGGNCFNDDIGPYMKIGIYSKYLDQGQTVTVYYDELRIGDASSSYNEVAPAPTSFPGDLDGDGCVDLVDLAMFVELWLQCNDPQNLDCEFPF